MQLDQLTTEARNEAAAEIDRLSPLEIVRLMNAEDARVAAAVGAGADAVAEAIQIAADRLQRGGRLVYLGAGTSGRLGVLDAAECPPTFNSRPWQVVGLIAGGRDALTRAVEGAEDQPELAVQDLQRIQLSSGDAVVGIATSGRTPYVLGGLAYAGQLGAATIGIACNPDSELAGVARTMIVPVVGAEVITGSTRLKAGTATKLVLNMLSTGAMVLLGKTYGNLMVDLQTTNRKLADRSRRIVGQLAEVDRETAERLLQACRGDTKTAIVAHRRGVAAEAARAALARSGGRLRRALEATESPGNTAVPDQRGIGGAGCEPLLLGVDGGGSGTRARIAVAAGDGWRALGQGEAGPSNPQAEGWPAALGNLELAIARSFADAGISPRRVAAAGLAVAGAGRDADQQRLRAWAAQVDLADRIETAHDAEALLAGGTPDGFGVAVIAGTGSIAFGRNPAGVTARSGGWGPVMGDEGSGCAIAAAALQAVARAEDGRGPQTALRYSLLRAAGVGAPAELIAAAARQGDRRWLAEFARPVLQEAESGDQVARAIIDQAADCLEEMARAVLIRLRRDGDWERPPLALGGGLLANCALLRERLLARLTASAEVLGPVAVVADSLEGPLRLAFRRLHADHPGAVTA